MPFCFEMHRFLAKAICIKAFLYASVSFSNHCIFSLCRFGGFLYPESSFAYQRSTFLYTPPKFSLPTLLYRGARSLLRSYIHPFGLYKRSLQPAHTSPPGPHPAPPGPPPHPPPGPPGPPPTRPRPARNPSRPPGPGRPAPHLDPPGPPKLTAGAGDIAA